MARNHYMKIISCGRSSSRNCTLTLRNWMTASLYPYYQCILWNNDAIWRAERQLKLHGSRSPAVLPSCVHCSRCRTTSASERESQHVPSLLSRQGAHSLPIISPGHGFPLSMFYVYASMLYAFSNSAGDGGGASRYKTIHHSPLINMLFIIPCS